MQQNMPSGGGFAPWRGEAVRAHAALGETDEATSLAAMNLRLARQFGAPDALSFALRTCAVVETGRTPG